MCLILFLSYYTCISGFLCRNQRSESTSSPTSNPVVVITRVTDKFITKATAGDDDDDAVPSNYMKALHLSLKKEGVTVFFLLSQQCFVSDFFCHFNQLFVIQETHFVSRVEFIAIVSLRNTNTICKHSLKFDQRSFVTCLSS